MPAESNSADRLLPGGITRRALLAGGAGAVLLAACGSSGGSSGAGSTIAGDQEPSLLAFFPADDYFTAGVSQRAAFGVANPGGGLSTKTPAQLTFTLSGPGSYKEQFVVDAHRKELPWSYYPFDFTTSKVGTYTAATSVDGKIVNAIFTVGAKGSSKVPETGSPMPAMKTPTPTDTLGVDPICTNDPACPLHTVSLDTALAAHKPIAYLVATPKFCQTGICGPVLDVLLTAHKTYGDRITFIHQEVYQRASDAAEKGSAAKLTAAVVELGLVSEPVLFLVDTTGHVTHRLDAAYDGDELSKGLDALLA